MVKTREFKVGLFVAMAIVLLYFGFNYLRGIDFFTSVKRYYVVYDNINQLAVSNPVLVNGYPVGRVSKIGILQNRNNRVLVELEIDGTILLTDGTKATLTSELLGGKSVLLTFGQYSKKLKNGDTLRAEVAKGMFDVFSETASPVATDLQTTLRKFNTIIDNLTKNSQQLQVIFSKLENTPNLLNTTLVTANGKIQDVSGTLKSVGENFNTTLNELKPTLQNFKTLSDSLKMLKLNQTLSKTQQAISNLNVTLGKLNKGDNTMSKLLTEDTLYVNLNKLIKSLDSLANHLNNNPKHFLSPFGKSKKRIDRDRRRDEKKTGLNTPVKKP
ncbi:MAG: MlaD family protein [Cyclobacteriaceae bacterium]|nr:MlaD family protein [Cyclobacteriaceae bacterium]